MNDRYIDAVWRARSVMDAIEAWLMTLSEQDRVTIARIQQDIRTPHISYDQAALAIYALVELGILEKQPEWHLNQPRLRETEAWRSGVRVGIEYTLAHVHSPPTRLLVALPLGLPLTIHEAVAAEADDLRSGLIGLLAGAQEHLLLASPFWDAATMTDLGDILLRRLNGGIHVDLLVRSLAQPYRDTQSFIPILERLAQHSACRIWTWNTPLVADQFGTQTFHFKCIVVDHGKRAYLGSANFTTASLRSRMELGVLLSGENAQTLSRIMSQILNRANRWNPTS